MTNIDTEQVVDQPIPTDDETAGQTATTSSDPADPPVGEDDDQDDTDGDGLTDGASPNRERRLRHRAQAAEAERDALAETLGRTRQAIVDAAVQAAGFDAAAFGRLLAAAERTADSESVLNDDGMVDTDKLAEAIRLTATEYNVQARSAGLTPNPQQGNNGGRPGGSSSWSSALKGR